MIRPVVYLGEKVLRDVAKPLILSTPAGKAAASQLAQDLLATVADQDGVGLAAPQIGVSQRMFVISGIPSRKRDPDDYDFRVVANPAILDASKSMVEEEEQCLSIPLLSGLVPRHKHITVEYESLEGDNVQETLSGLQARIFQHELDHLDGILFLDRMKDLKSLAMEQPPEIDWDLLSELDLEEEGRRDTEEAEQDRDGKPRVQVLSAQGKPLGRRRSE
mmetsp:Transcript_15238/g.30349  ORF Transcript_15238/g.30349 Transcript_15238/m.30349 type:complete len:219 (-) Transcript_15238:23-679(-)